MMGRQGAAKVGRRDGLQRAAAVAHEYDSLRGLTVSAAGVSFVFFGVLWPVGQMVALLGFSVTLAAGTAWADSWYAKRHGRVGTTWRRALGAAGAGAAAVVVLLVTLGLDHFEQPPVLTSLLATALLLWGGSWLALRRTGLGLHDHLAAAALAVLSTAPLWGLVPDVVDTVPYYLLAVGAVLLALGWFTHLRLLSLLGPERSVA